MTIFIGYIVLIGRIPEIRRVFAYHGAEHKTVNAYEAGLELTPENVARCSTAHYRCGTAFLLSVMVISILIFALADYALGEPPILLRLPLRILLVPLVAAVAYEYIKLTNRHRHRRLVQIVAAPNLAMQKLTTREPDVTMLEVAICALGRVLEKEGEAAVQAVAPEAVAAST